MLVFVEGKISYRKYTDKEGVEKNSTDIEAAAFRILEKLENGESRSLENNAAFDKIPNNNIRLAAEAVSEPDEAGLPF
jgi:single-stranded DNA-binding protein